jgi:hypothetical protein
MSDDLVKRLREDQPVTQDMVSTMQCALQDAAADRIERLEAELITAEQRGYANAMEAERKLHEERIEELEAKLAKAVDALDWIGNHMVMSMALNEDHLCRMMKQCARTTLAELKGETDD